MSSQSRGVPVHISLIASNVLSMLWAKTCSWRAARGEDPPPEHLNPNRTRPKE
ncbi:MULTISPECIES: hypothetical protein [Glycomyces]|uniref:Transposase n=2 Tax=Glycomyces TaxID=58113 RepID=A0ABU2AHV4_9ACTN|nr:hypothetical protein [Glycomyces lechevalierae]MDR7336796.1 hypothetical protein [Glycomyces lechevalierae]